MQLDLKHILKHLDIKQSDIARYSGYSKANVSKVVNHKINNNKILEVINKMIRGEVK
jgi:predicted XRE-type DNA-binding protein